MLTRVAKCLIKYGWSLTNRKEYTVIVKLRVKLTELQRSKQKIPALINRNYSFHLK